MTTPFLPYGRQTIEEDDIAAVVEVLRGDYLTTGPTVGRFEEAFARRTQSRHAVACSSGTAALHLAAMALGLGPDDCAIVPTMTFLATANAMRYVGAEVIFADVDPDTGLLTPASLREALARAPRKPSAVFPVHLNGQPCAMAEIQAIAREHDMAVVEDACHALAGSYLGPDRRESAIGACSHSDMAAFSLHPVKIIATGEGGMVTTNDPILQERLARYRTHGIQRDPARLENADLGFDGSGAPNPWYYEMPEYGYNYRISDINSALGLSQLAKLDRFIKRRREIADLYDRLLAPFHLVRPVPRVAHGVSGWHLYVALIDFTAAGVPRAQVMNGLRQRGIGTQVHYLPVHLQPYYRKRYGARDLPGSHRYYERILSLPLFPGMRDSDVEAVVTALRDVVEMAA